MKKILALSASLLTAMAFVSCADDPKPVVEPEPIISSSEMMSSSAAPVVVKEDPREVRRRYLQGLLDKLMSEDVYFDYDAAELNPAARQLLAEVGEILIREKAFTIELQGHTDDRGTESYNMRLGDKRSQIVFDYLTGLGVSNTMLTTVSFGEEAPKEQGEDEASYAKNRRAHFNVKISG
ncbi:OmpA family protein [Fibrobacterales bacterium]|nr:OmpA family protein [Fibrobacterales bacterium]